MNSSPLAFDCLRMLRWSPRSELMAKEDLGRLGFREGASASKRVQEQSDAREQNRRGFVAGVPTPPKESR